MKCKLCDEDKILIKKSHIIPDFMHDGLYDKDHKLFRIDYQNFSKTRKLFTGEYDKNILCADCDNKIIGGYETYSSRIYFGGRLFKGEDIKFENRKNKHGVVTTYINGLNYNKFKLFLLSILWRASISNRKFFNQVSLGPHEDVIKNMIINGDAGKQKQYPCLMTTYQNLKKELTTDLIGQPIRVKNSDGTKYVFLIGGFWYMFFISQHRVPGFIFECVINEGGEMSIVHMSREQGVEMLNYFLGVEMFK